MMKETLKYCLATVLLALMPFVIITIVLYSDEKVNTNEYYRSAEVFRIENEVVYLEDTQGNVWCAEDDTLKMFGRYILVMDNCGTEDITDERAYSAEQTSSDGVKYKILTWWNKYNINFIIKFAEAQGWSITEEHK